MVAESKSTSLPTIVQYPATHQYMLEHGLTSMTDVQKKQWTHVEADSQRIMASAPDEANFLGLLCQLIGAKKVIEVGTYLGTTTLAIALSLPEDGKIHALDLESELIDQAKPFWEEAKVAHKINIHIGPAAASMEALRSEAGTFDLVFIDADKTNYDVYYELALVLLRPGGVIAVDNVLWGGRVVKCDQDASTQAIQALNKKLAHDERVSISMLAMADGLTICRKK